MPDSTKPYFMCGIAGWYRRSGRPVDRRAITAQCEAILHRGPDQDGLLVEGDFGFGMRRLSIVDLAGGQQPVISEDGCHALTFNGEIYNHLELRRELEAAGHRFRSVSDTETILVAWQQWGDAAWARLEGMFAIALWDRPQRRLTLVRDPLGIKPLYITEQMGGLAYASEIKALLPLPDHAFSVDPHAVHSYFSFAHVRPPQSIYSQVRSLAPGHLLTIGPEGESRSRAYWSLRFQEGPRQSEADWIAQFREIWLATVRRHMQADVPVGTFLSGGVDSSAVTAAMARVTGQPVRAYTIGFQEARFDETAHARDVARHLGCEHIVRVVDLQDARDLLPRIQHCYDEPFADPAAVPSWYLAEAASQDLKVVLAGDGGDEIFAGYRRHANEARSLRNASWLPALRPLSRALQALPDLPSRQVTRLRRSLDRQCDMARLPDGYSRFFARTEIVSAALREAIYQPSYHAEQASRGTFTNLRDEFFPETGDGPADGMEQFLLADTLLQLPGQMLTKVDRASMAHSLEVRVPFLSHKLVDWAATMPMSMKLRGNLGKYVVRKAVEPWLPPGLLDRPKQGFKMPLAQWFRGEFGRYARSVWHDSGASRAGYLDSAAVDQLFRQHATGAHDHSRILYAIAIFALWWQGRSTARPEWAGRVPF
ncbi:asparagine synthase (glutamine-hydrolyzing) [Roseomonas sp. ACRSG]|nr:asparagine synthase (glutamine-hydrolyzing) [Roseomonas sp. ACRSG]